MDAAHEALLVQQARSHPESFRLLYDIYFPRIYRYVGARIGHREDTEDVVAEIFIRMSAHLGQFEYRGEGSFAAWLFRIAHNEISSFYRHRSQRQQFLPLDTVEEVRTDLPTPDRHYSQQERAARLQRTIATLSPRRQEIVQLKFFGGLRNQEIAAVLGLDERSVASHLSRALRDLQHLMEGESQHD